jgi:hypothetical protein
VIDGRERGYVGAEVAISIGLLIFPVTLLVLTLPTWSERQTTARAVAREVAREVAIAGVCDRAQAFDTAMGMAANLGLPAGDLTIAVDCATGARLPRGGEITAAVTVAMPAVELPGIGSLGAWSWTPRHREPIDQYRSFDP